MILREDFLQANEPSPKIVRADAYDKMMERENFLNVESSQNSEVEDVRDWNHHRWEEEGKEPLNSLHTKFNHWKVGGLGRRPIIQDEFFAVTSGIRPTSFKSGSTDNFSGDFNSVQGKGKLCKAGGLTGADKKACAKNIKAKCGKKPMFGKAKKEAWSQCASALVVTPEDAAAATAEKLIPTSDTDVEGMSTGAKVLISVAVIGTLALVGFAIMKSRKKA